MQGIRLLAMLGLCFLSLTSFAVVKDLKGSQDHPLVSRYPGTRIITYVAKDFDEYLLPLSAPDSRGSSKLKFKKSMELEGKITRIGYTIKPTTSSLKIFKNFESAFKKSGFKVKFSCNKKGCGEPGKWQKFFVKNQVWGQQKSQRVMAVHKKIKNQDIYIFLLVGNQGQRITVGLDVVEVKGMENNLIAIDENSLQQILETEGKIALYDIKFEIDKATLLESSKKSINVLANVLNKNMKLQVYIVGHTDDSGTPKHNIALSNQRAQTVVQELVTEHKIDIKRMIAFGAGSFSPIGSNVTDDGRALNRRVEVVKRLRSE